MGLLTLFYLVALAGSPLSAGLTLSRGPHAEYYWPHARGHPGRYSATEHIAPANLTSAISWSWHHPEGRYHTVVLGALLDDKKNIYLASEDGIRKFTKDGAMLWHYSATGSVTTCPSLMDGLLYGNTQSGYVFALDMESGSEVWNLKKAESVPGDTGYVESLEGVVVTQVDSTSQPGSRTLLGLDAKTGSKIWEYTPDEVIWNAMAVFPGDGSAILMDIHGGVFKVGLHNGTLLWRTTAPSPSQASFSDGGVMLGPDGTSYTCSNGFGSGQHGQHGNLRAYRLSDGHLLWDQFLEYPCNSWPVVTPNGEVVVPSGEFVGSPASSDVGRLIGARKMTGNDGLTFFDLQRYSLSLGNNEMRAYGMQDHTARMAAFDAKTGQPRWSTELPPFGRMAALGDEEGWIERRVRHQRDQCLPAQFGAPTVSGNGDIYVGRADGKLYAVEPRTGKYRVFDTEAGFLHPGTIWAPGLMAVPSCDGLFVWTW
jgi:outer membrane protein assembly factor BamB